MSIGVIVQARINSTRFPEKIMQIINGKSIIELLLKRLSFSKTIKKIIVAIPDNKKNKKLENFLKQKKINVFLGDEDNVLKRYYDAAKKNKLKIIIRITADCPLVDPYLLENYVKIFISSKVDYLSNVCPPTYPDGLDIEIFNFDTLEKTIRLVKKKYDKEHVTSYIQKSNRFKILNLKYTDNYSKLRLTLDEKEDLNVIKAIFNYFKPRLDFKWEDILTYYKKNKKVFNKNSFISRNEGATLSNGQKIWKRAKKVIPGGNMLLSKRPDLFLPNLWPTYFKKSKGCQVWDLDKKKYYDTSLMGVGTNILGYSNKEVNQAVKKAITDGISSTLNCYEEVYLAEKLIEINPWAQMVKFARTGGEANAIAIRIARAASGKDNVAFCGYHGWHDWYLAANISDNKSLNNHLLPDLSSKGIPKNLINSSFPFNYNNYDQLEKIISENKVGCVIMEVYRNIEPENNFLHKVRKITKEKNIILIFDECTSAFRQCFGGLHKKYGVEPDMAMFGKSMGNGHPITAVVGKKEIMEISQDTFMSSTFWTERIGSVAGLKTLEVMERIQSWNTINNIGNKVDGFWKNMGKEYNLNITTLGLPALKSFSIKSDNWLKYKTFITQEMLKKGFLASNAFFSCIDHTDEILNKYFVAIEPLFKTISDCERGILSIDKILTTPCCVSGFKRLN